MQPIMRPSSHNQPLDPNALLRPRHLSERWDKSPRTLQRWRAEGRGPAWLKIGGSIFYRLGDVMAYEEARRRDGEPGDDR